MLSKPVKGWQLERSYLIPSGQFRTSVERWLRAPGTDVVGCGMALLRVCMADCAAREVEWHHVHLIKLVYSMRGSQHEQATGNRVLLSSATHLMLLRALAA